MLGWSEVDGDTFRLAEAETEPRTVIARQP